jgi:response regulator RpfG family c-di-GMP phosphodiesterase
VRNARPGSHIGAIGFIPKPFKADRPVESAIDELLHERRRQFDPAAVDAFVATLDRAGDYHDVVDTVSELELIALRAKAFAI